MSAIIGGLSWVVVNWQTIATAFSAGSSIALFFMHGNAKQDLAELKDFVNSLNVSQTQTPTDQSKKGV